MISHKEVRTLEGERQLYDASAFGLKWGDAEEIVNMAEKIIFDIALLINNTSWVLDNIIEAHQESAKSLWTTRA